MALSTRRKILSIEVSPMARTARASSRSLLGSQTASIAAFQSSHATTASAATYGLDEFRVVAAVAQSLAESRDVLREVSLFNNGVGPERLREAVDSRASYVPTKERIKFIRTIAGLPWD
jgi:hypothetical protein